MSFHSVSSLPPRDQCLFNHFGRGKPVLLAHQTITDAFETIVSTDPYAAAVRECFGSERTVTYVELERLSNIVANLLIDNYGVRPGHRVVCVFSRCVEMCAFIMGVLKAGCQYVPIDGAVMVEGTLRHVIRDSGASVVLCLSSFRDKVERSMPEEQPVSIMALDASDAIWRTGNARSPVVSIQPEDGAYVIYTSGTTGKPKGVDCSHENVVNTLTNEPGKLGIANGVNVACVLMLGFDMCAWEVLGTLINGGTLNLRGTSQRGGDRWVWDACLRGVDVVISTPSGAQKYFPRRADFPNIKTIAVGGEPCPVSLAEEWAPHVRFQNICGPTEITILNSAKIHQPGTELTIGKPIPNTNVYILDEDLYPVRIGDTGLIWVGGLGVSRGYVNLPKLTAERYRTDKFTLDGRMMFNTGDLGRWDENGELVPLGRKDDQVKIKGCRVELDGVSASVESFQAVEKACALKVGAELWCFFAGSAAIDDKALEAHLATRLNHYARPSRLIHLPSMPMTPGGKIDKNALKELAAEGTEIEELKVITTLQSPPPVYFSSRNEVDEAATIEKGCMVQTSSVQDCDEDEIVEKDISLPEKNGVHGGRWLRHKGLAAYRKLFILVLSINVIVFLAMAANSGAGLPVDQLATAVAANLLVAVLFRQDHVVNFVFWLVTRVPTSTPFWIRRHLARCYHMGGFHSGAAVAATLWWTVFAAQSTIYFVQDSKIYPISTPTVGLTFTILVLLILILGMAWPSVRMKLHDQFEWTHRFAGWTTLILVWAHIVVSTASLKDSDVPLSVAVQRSPAVWLVALTTFSVALPWMRLRKVNVIVEPLSQHAVRLHFDFCTPPPGRAIRISDNPLREWHAFATITDPGQAGFSIVVSRAGDWTGRLIESPPPPTTTTTTTMTGGKIWTRGVPASGVLRMAPLFRKIVLVATGSGIGPCLPVILKKEVPCRVFWSASNHEKTFGAKIIAGVRDSDPDAVLWNTKERGRPDLALEAYKLYKSSGAECVCVISNGPVTEKLVYDLEKRGVPAFGPILDS